VSTVQHDPQAPDFDPEHYLRERYAGHRDGQSPLVRAYYTLKPLLPRRLQLAMRRRYAQRQAQREFPRWPIEPILVEHMHARLARELADAGASALPIVNFWPDGKRFCAIVSHDVEGPAGIENIPRVLEVEERHGIVSSWNFVAEDYEIPGSAFPLLRDAGCEVGLHGIHHDGMLFRDRQHFEADLPKIHRYLDEWGAVGFRSPATHRNADWMPELGCLYDGSFPDTDPFEPQSGGCCSIHPYFLGDMVELPITLVQDHTLWEILGDDSTSLWEEKSDWIAANHGLVHLLVHPDYLLESDRLALYDRFLAYLTRQEGVWHALPRDVAAWWKRRASLDARSADADAEATVAYARQGEDGRIRFDAEPREAA
jgi:peptidoglycan/xylan/chitin deacetylase (PgdA/CDA1 family)